MVVRLSGLLLVMCLVGGAARGDEAPYEPPDFMKEAPPLPASAAGREVWRLDLAEALRLAVRQNLGIAIERQAVQIARLGVGVARRGFEPVVTASYGHDRADSPPLTSQQGGAGTNVTSTDDTWRLSIGQRLA